MSETGLEGRLGHLRDKGRLKEKEKGLRDEGF